MPNSPRPTSRRPIAITTAMLGGLALAAFGVAVPAHAVDVPVSTDTEFVAAITATAADGDVVVLAGDFSVVGAQAIANSITLDLAGHAIATQQLLLTPGISVTLRDSVGGGTLDVQPWDGAGIRTHGATLTVESGTVTTTAWHGAGIGGNDGEGCGTIVILGGTVEATGAADGAGIGSGYNATGEACDVTIAGGTVTATGSPYAAAIGSGQLTDGGTVTITGGDVTAIGTSVSAAIGAGWEAGGVTVSMGPAATVTVDPVDGRAFGAGVDGSPFGTVTIAGTVTVPAGEEILIPAGGTVTVAPTGLITGDGALTGAGTVANGGTLTVAGIDDVETGGTLNVTGNNHVVTFDANNADATPATSQLRAYGPTLDAVGLALPAPTASGVTLTAWNTAADGSGTAFTTATALTGDLMVYAIWPGMLAASGADAGGVLLAAGGLLVLGIGALTVGVRRRVA